MFNREELLIIASALVVQRKSVQRLANKEGQPESVSAEYRKVDVALATVQDKVSKEFVKLDAVKK